MHKGTGIFHNLNGDIVVLLNINSKIYQHKKILFAHMIYLLLLYM